MNEILKKQVDVEGLIEKLDFAEENVLEATRAQPGLFLEASRYRVKSMRRRAKALFELETSMADAALILRQKKNAQGKKEMTETAIKEKVMLNSVVKDARIRLDRAYEEEELAKLLVEAYRQRRDACRIIVDALGAEIQSEVKLAQIEGERGDMTALKKKVREKFRGRR